MIDDDFLLNDDDEFEEDLSSSALEEDNPFEDDEESSSDRDKRGPKLDSSVYEGRMSSLELEYIKLYDAVSKCEDIKDACTYIVGANPTHTSSSTIGFIIKDMFHLQGHHRMQSTLYTPSGLMSSEEFANAMGESEDEDFNVQYAEEARDLITRFIGYLADRDLSDESISSQRRKKRQIPAFLIFLFSSGMYDLILDCPTLPEYYQKQVKEAFHRINQSKHEVVEELAQEYERLGRPKVGAKVRELGLSWFDKEPAEIKSAAQFRDLEITNDDVETYRQFRGKFTNISRALTLDTISNLIDVAIDPDRGIYEKLKDKTRTEAINDVKEEYKRFVDREDPAKSEIASKVIFKTLRD